MQHPRSTRHGAVLALGIICLLAIAAACTPPPVDPGATTTTTITTEPPAESAFCRIMRLRSERGPDGQAPPVRPFSYELDDGSIVTAREVVQVGKECTDPGAKLTFHQGKVVGKDIWFPAHNHLDGPVIESTPYSLTLDAGQPQAPNIEIASLNIELSWTGIRIYGTLRVTLDGASSIISFDGWLQDLENFSLSVDAPSLLLPGLSDVPLRLSGRFERRAGVNSLSFSGRAERLRLGETTVEEASLDLAASTTTGLQIAVDATVRTNGTTAAAHFSADYDANGVLRNMDGSFALVTQGVAPDGSLYSLDGVVMLSGDGTHLVGTFSGSAVFGDTVISRAAGTVEVGIDGRVLLWGVFEGSSGGLSVRLEGSLELSQGAAYPQISALAEGAFTGVTDNGDIVEVRGRVRIDNNGGVTTTSVEGSLRVGTLSGSAQAVVTTNGTRTTLAVDGSIETGSIRAQVNGTIVFDGTSVESIDLGGQLRGAVQVGDVSATGNVMIQGGTDGWNASIQGRFISGATDVRGDAKLLIDRHGTLLYMSAWVDGTVVGHDRGMASFRGSMVADAQRVVFTGAGQIVGKGANYGQVSGRISVSGGVVSVDLHGQVSLSQGDRTGLFGDVHIVDSVLRMARVTVVFPPMLIDPEWVWISFEQDAEGRCTEMSIYETSFLIGIFAGRQRTADALGCPV